LRFYIIGLSFAEYVKIAGKADYVAGVHGHKCGGQDEIGYSLRCREAKKIAE
jgi:hypothetical protein